MIRNFIFSIAGTVFFVGWSIYVFYVSKDAFSWEEMNLQSAILAILQALLILTICFLPVMLIGGGIKVSTKINSKKSENQE